MRSPPCNLSLDRLAKRAKEGVRAAGGFPLECGMHAERFDGAVLLAGCDKSEPGMLMAAARLDLAAVFLYAGSTLPGRLNGRDVTIIDAFEAVGACLAGKMTRDEVDAIERAVCP